MSAVKAAQITARGRIELIDLPDHQSPATGHVVVKAETGCLCGSDIPFFSEAQPSYPLPPGLSLHEIIGRVTASASASFKEGDRVLAMPLGLVGCAEQLLIGDDRLVAIDPALNNETAVIAQPMATVLSALSTIPNVIGLNVAVLGQGPIGLLFNTCLASAGAARVIGIDVREARVARSCEFGATDAFVTREKNGSDAGRDAVERVAELTGGVMADVVVEAVGHEQQQLNLACALARKKGRLLYFGIPPDQPIPFALEPVVRKSLTIHTSVPDDLRPFVMIAQRAIRRGRLDPAKLITHRFPFAEVQQAFETYRDRSGLKVILEF